MKLETEDDELYALITAERYRGRKYQKLSRQKGFMKNLASVIDTLRRAPDVSVLACYGSLHYECLKGDRAGQSSVRIGYSSPYRLIFTEHEDGLLLKLIEISNHYGDH